MKEFKYVITDPEGIHARPAGLLVKQAAEYKSPLKSTKQRRAVDEENPWSHGTRSKDR